jgi:addiction module HigA family antidote
VTPTTLKSSITTETSELTMKTLPNIHPGEVLLEEFLTPMGISQNALARAASVPPRRINEIVLGKRGVTADTAVRLAAALGTSERFWLGLQADFDLEEAHRALGNAVLNIERKKGVRDNFRDNLQAMSGPLKLSPTPLLLLRETLSRIKDKNGARFTYNRLNCCVAAYERAVRRRSGGS